MTAWHLGAAGIGGSAPGSCGGRFPCRPSGPVIVRCQPSSAKADGAGENFFPPVSSTWILPIIPAPQGVLPVDQICQPLTIGEGRMPVENRPGQPVDLPLGGLGLHRRQHRDHGRCCGFPGQIMRSRDGSQVQRIGFTDHGLIPQSALRQVRPGNLDTELVEAVHLRARCCRKSVGSNWQFTCQQRHLFAQNLVAEQLAGVNPQWRSASDSSVAAVSGFRTSICLRCRTTRRQSCSERMQCRWSGICRTRIGRSRHLLVGILQYTSFSLTRTANGRHAGGNRDRFHHRGEPVPRPPSYCPRPNDFS